MGLFTHIKGLRNLTVASPELSTIAIFGCVANANGDRHKNNVPMKEMK
jgi:4-hydroxy-3-methylbut-2-en-1-yl diphosphate synthase IspG/GcpE